MNIIPDFLTHFAALGFLIVTLVTQIFVYPNAFDTHGTWVVAFLLLMKYGAGRLSLDYPLSATSRLRRTPDRRVARPVAISCDIAFAGDGTGLLRIDEH
jgi:hypothetical protein